MPLPRLLTRPLESYHRVNDPPERSNLYFAPSGLGMLGKESLRGDTVDRRGEVWHNLQTIQ